MRHVLTGTEDPATTAKKINANFAELYSIAQAAGAAIEPAAIVENKSQIAFSSLIPLNQIHPLTMPAQKVSAGLAFALAANPVNTSEVRVALIANGDPTCVPNFGEFSRHPGGAEWVNDDGAVNVVTFTFRGGMPYYDIHRVA